MLKKVGIRKKHNSKPLHPKLSNWRIKTKNWDRITHFVLDVKAKCFNVENYTPKLKSAKSSRNLKS
jgi:hypothetical protein